MTRRIFLPGAGGSAAFWQLVAEYLGPRPGDVFLFWPGLGDEPPDPRVSSIDGLVDLVVSHLDRPADLIAQSMGGVIALRATLVRPHQVRRLVLTATSGGLPMRDLGAVDWRADYFQSFPKAAAWIAAPVADVSPRLSQITQPTLLIWGDQDPISPLAVGERLQQALPTARMVVVPGGAHDVAQTHATTVAGMIADHLNADTAS